MNLFSRTSGYVRIMIALIVTKMYNMGKRVLENDYENFILRILGMIVVLIDSVGTVLELLIQD